MLKKAAGFTLIELIITMAILAIIATIAIPGFSNLIENNRLASGSNLLVSSIKFARAEAIKRGTDVTFSIDSSLADGWCVHTGDASGSCASDQIREFEAPDNLKFTAGVNDMVFDRRGFLTSQTERTFDVYPKGCASGETSLKKITVSPLGRTQIADGACP